MTSPAEPQRPPRQQPLGDLRARGREMRARQQEQKAARSAPAPAVPDWRQTARSTPPPSGVPGREEQAARSELPPEPELPDPFGADLDAVLPDSLDGIDWGPAGPPGRKTGSGHGGWAASRRRAGPSVSDPRPRQLAEI